MKVMILGIDGYLGWPLALHLIKKGHEVSGIDNFSRRRRVADISSDSLTPIAPPKIRQIMLEDFMSKSINKIYYHEEMPVDEVEDFLHFVNPDAIVHLAEQPSAPYSMIDSAHAAETQLDNVIGTLRLLWYMKQSCPQAHLIKLGTMGEYGTPNCDIPEGHIPFACLSGHKFPSGCYIECSMGGLIFPRRAGSWYHLSKVLDSYNIEFACRNWGLASTDIMQGPVFGVKTPDTTSDDLITRFDYDEIFGTVINRFCAQAIIKHPLTVYGEGGQTRGYLPLSDSMECMTIAIENPPKPGEYRVFNQFERTYSINELAAIVQKAAYLNDIDVDIKHYENPRKEAETHYYNPYRDKLVKLGYKPTINILPKVTELIKDIKPYADNVIKDVIVPSIRWDIKHRKSEIVK